MFNRFTKEARAVVRRAADEARVLGDPQVRPEHVLLGVIGHGGAAADTVGIVEGELRTLIADARHERDAAALMALGIELDAVIERVEQRFGPGALRGAGGRPTFAATTRTALEGALAAAIELREHRIGPRHLLLGLIGAADPLVEQLLRAAGKTPEEIRATLLSERAARAA